MKAIVLFEFDVDESAADPTLIDRWHRTVSRIREELRGAELQPVMGYVAIHDVADAVLARMRASIPPPVEPVEEREPDEQLGFEP